MNEWRGNCQFIRRCCVAKHNLGKGIQIRYSDRTISFLILWIITFFICQHFSIVPKINTHSPPWPYQGTAYIHNFTESGWSEKNRLPKQRSSKKYETQKNEKFLFTSCPKGNFSVKIDEDGREFLAVFVFLYFYICEFVSFLIENTEDWSWHCQQFLMGESICLLSCWHLTATAAWKSVQVLTSKFACHCRDVVRSWKKAMSIWSSSVNFAWTARNNVVWWQASYTFH